MCATDPETFILPKSSFRSSDYSMNRVLCMRKQTLIKEHNVNIK
jgi:hypothetical protein